MSSSSMKQIYLILNCATFLIAASNCVPLLMPGSLLNNSANVTENANNNNTVADECFTNGALKCLTTYYTRYGLTVLTKETYMEEVCCAVADYESCMQKAYNDCGFSGSVYPTSATVMPDCSKQSSAHCSGGGGVTGSGKGGGNYVGSDRSVVALTYFWLMIVFQTM